MSAINSEARCVLQYFLCINSDLRLRHQIMPLHCSFPSLPLSAASAFVRSSSNELWPVDSAAAMLPTMSMHPPPQPR